MLRNSTAPAARFMRVLPHTSVRHSSSSSDEQAPKIPLSKRIAIGRAKLLEISPDDPFASFLLAPQEKPTASPNRSRSNFTLQKPKAQEQGQQPVDLSRFDDADLEASTNHILDDILFVPTTPKVQNPTQFKQRPRAQTQNRSNQPRPVRKSTPRTFSPSKQQARSEPRKSQTFVVQDIDWSQYDDDGPIVPTSNNPEEERVQQRLESQGGDYDRYLSIGEGMEVGTMVPTESTQAVSMVIGQNAAYSLTDKALLLKLVSSGFREGKETAATK